MKTLVAVNCLQDIACEVYASHCQFWGYTKHKFCNDQFLFYSPSRMSIDRMRNEAAKIALEHECDYLMFIDDDVVIRPNLFESLFSVQKDIVAALTIIRGYPYEPMVFRFEGNNLIIDRSSTFEIPGVYDCDAVGFSSVLIKTELLKKIDPPYFLTGPRNTEDVYFCIKCIDRLGRDNVSIAVDSRVPTSHSLGRDFIDIGNRKSRLLYDEELLPQLKERQNGKDGKIDRTYEKVAEMLHEPLETESVKKT